MTTQSRHPHQTGKFPEVQVDGEKRQGKFSHRLQEGEECSKASRTEVLCPLRTEWSSKGPLKINMSYRFGLVRMCDLNGE